MRSSSLALLEILLVFGSVLLFGWWQLRALDKSDRIRKEREANRATDKD